MILQFPRVNINEYSWSPDGRYIAFWVIDNPDPNAGESLVILDTTTKTVTNYCITGMGKGVGASAPIWSPNGQQVVVESYNTFNKLGPVILVDIEHGWAAQIAQDMIPEGWMVSP